MENFSEYVEFIKKSELENDDDSLIIDADGVPMAPLVKHAPPEPGCIFDSYNDQEAAA